MPTPISTFVASQKSYNDRQGAAIDSIVKSFAGLSSDIADLNRTITELQNSPGQVTPEDQALIDELQTAGSELVNRAEAVAAGLAKLDAAQPPVVPVPTE